MNPRPCGNSTRWPSRPRSGASASHHLNIGQPDLQTPPAYFDAVRNFDSATLAYAASPGTPELIDAVRAYYRELDVDLEPDDVLITTGGSEALLLTCLSILDPYTEVIIPEPYYPNYTTFVHAAGGVIRALPTCAEEGYRYAKRERIESLITKNTRAILITNPGNPTGVVLNQEEMRMIADVAKKHDLFLICDEVYREFCYDDSFGVPTMARFRDVDENVVIVDSVSKRFSACGARVGCVVTRNKELQQAILKFCQSRLSVATIDQVGAAALYGVDHEFFRRSKEEYRKRRDTVVRRLRAIPGVQVEEPMGAFYLMAGLPWTIPTSSSGGCWRNSITKERRSCLPPAHPSTRPPARASMRSALPTSVRSRNWNGPWTCWKRPSPGIRRNVCKKSAHRLAGRFFTFSAPERRFPWSVPAE